MLEMAINNLEVQVVSQKDRVDIVSVCDYKYL